MSTDRIAMLLAACLAVSLLLLGGCKAGPNYAKPSAPVSDEWEAGEEGEHINTAEGPQAEWWKVFDDAVLDDLIEKSHMQNLSLKVAGVRILQAMALRGIAVGELFPQYQALNGDFTRARTSGNLGAPLPAYSSIWRTGLDAAWELDFWGKFRRQIESATADLGASVANFDAVLVTLTAEVALAYLEIRTLQMRIRIAHANVERQEKGVRLAEIRQQEGATSELDPAQVKTLAARTRASIPSLQIDLRRAAYRLTFLMGSRPHDILEELGNPGTMPEAPASIAVGIPADLLRRRPDIRLAERQAAAASARIGVAKAELYPAFSLGGSLGFTANDLGNVFQGDSWAGRIVPGFSWPIFNYGRIRNNVRFQDAEFKAAILNFQNQVLQAASEVEGSLAGFVGSLAREVHLREAVAHSQRALDLGTIQYQEGTADFQRVLDALAGLQELQDALVTTRGQVAANLIATYKALGGGWELQQQGGCR